MQTLNLSVCVRMSERRPVKHTHKQRYNIQRDRDAKRDYNAVIEKHFQRLQIITQFSQNNSIMLIFEPMLIEVNEGKG
jgi:hypothetical protein